MIKHGFVVVGLFYAAEIIFRRYETRAIAGGIQAITKIHFDVFDFGISICCFANYFNFIENSPFCTVFHKLIFGLPF
jgi:NADH:ubiquinone oxidoreductase subunit 4 (subunit M)